MSEKLGVLQKALDRNFFVKELSLRKLQEGINKQIENRLARINAKGRMSYFSWDEAFLSLKDCKQVFDETFAEDKRLFEDFARKFATYRADLEKKLTHIEVRNNTPQSIKVGICRSKLSGLLYIEVGEACHAFKVEPMYYEMVEINEVEF